MSTDGSVGKDIVYIDVEDDVTSVISKVRASDQKIVALVPPKNIGALQSAVNLRLLTRAADNAGKRLVLITNNSGLTALAAGVKIPVAKNLQSKPEIPIAAAKVDEADEDIIKGEELPVGELAAATNEAVAAAPATSASAAFVPAAPKVSDDDITIEDLPDLDSDAPIAAAAVGSAKKAKKAPHGSMSKVPNFSRFRKWMFIGGGLIVAIILFFILGNIFWTGTSIVITAQTSNVPVSQSLTLTTTGATNANTSTIQAASKQLQKTQSVTFTPTGTKNIGNKATGTVNFTNATTGSVSIAAGTTLSTSDGTDFTLDKSTTVPAGSVNCTTVFSCNGTAGKASGSVTASNGGESGNGESGTVTGTPDGITGTFQGSTSGGTDNNVTVVTDADITKAESQLSANTSDAASAKTQLMSQFGGDYVTLANSFTSQAGSPTPSPASGQQATTGKVSVVTTYTLEAIAKSQVSTITTTYLTSQLSASNQKIYDDGSTTATVANFTTSPGGVQTLTLQATGKVGPNISDAAVKQQAVGQKREQIRQEILAINGVKDVNVTINPFWATTAPSADKIKVSFNIAGNV